MKIHEKYIKRCIQLAQNGLGGTYPNPLVGSVVVYEDRILGEGWHRKAGEPHAEVVAINRVTERHLFAQATLYVSLEPCNHYGKTPPCTNFILQAGIKNVVIGTVDPYYKVAGSGIQKLREAGCAVTVGVLEGACQELNRRFFTFHLEKRPYVILKWAESRDGYLGSKTDTSPLAESVDMAKPEWVSNEYSRQLVHKWRTEEQAVLTGSKTVLRDNPSLTARAWAGANPVRVVLGKWAVIPKEYRVWDGDTKTIFIGSDVCFNSRGGALCERIDARTHAAAQVCEVLYRHSLQSVIVEGGAQTLQTFIDENLWDEARVFTGTGVFAGGTQAPKLSAISTGEQWIEGDLLKIYRNYGKKYHF